MNVIIGIFSVVGGYMLAVFTWDKFHTWLIGSEAKAAQLRDRAKALMAKARAAL